MAQTLPFATNVTLQVAPPDVFVPNTAGVALPVGLHQLDLLLDMTTVPSTDRIAFMVQLSPDGGVTWRDYAGATLQGGSWTNPATSVVSFINPLRFVVPQADSSFGYPTHARVHILTVDERVTLSISGSVS